MCERKEELEKTNALVHSALWILQKYECTNSNATLLLALPHAVRLLICLLRKIGTKIISEFSQNKKIISEFGVLDTGNKLYKENISTQQRFDCGKRISEDIIVRYLDGLNSSVIAFIRK